MTKVEEKGTKSKPTIAGKKRNETSEFKKSNLEFTESII